MEYQSGSASLFAVAARGGFTERRQYPSVPCELSDTQKKYHELHAEVVEIEKELGMDVPVVEGRLDFARNDALLERLRAVRWQLAIMNGWGE